MEIPIIISLALALIPALLIAVNLSLYRAAPPPDPDYRPQVSLLIPARDEETRIEAAVHAALASDAVDLEVIVLDDHSSDRTAELVRNIAQCDPRS
jgi:cellulose synthase/poly-beta-1,6-N-acetylglucosamine synthase-like glycosyltransferase